MLNFPLAFSLIFAIVHRAIEPVSRYKMLLQALRFENRKRN